ncbi:MAG: nickel/cobalt transporter (NiCoT) family protein [Actinomycetota bacterium]|jgi:high-affinity nickel-transport protein|nr:nickel/cobalt transporter (NiCoT) family protein [Actinomycetota bacterium]
MLLDATAPAPVRKRLIHFDRDEKVRLGLLFGAVAALHVIGFGLFMHYNSIAKYHQIADSKGTLLYAGAASLAYVFGLRHAFDADHIAAIDDTTRLLLQKGRKPLGVGFCFSLGHSTVVFALSFGIAVAAKAAAGFQQQFAGLGGVIGASVSGVFLYVIAGFNFVILLGILRTWKDMKRGSYTPDQLDELLAQRGMMNRIFKGRYNKFINHSWQMYPVGILFGLGFDTATEVGFLAISATAATAAVGSGVSLPPLAIIALPIIFAAGMSLMDTFDGVFMCKAYDWAFTNPLRKIFYNISTTGLSIFVAFVIGTIELVSVISRKGGFADTQPFSYIGSIDLNRIGYFIVGVFLVTWLGSVAIWKYGRIEQRYSRHLASHTEPAAAADYAA